MMECMDDDDGPSCVETWWSAFTEITGSDPCLSMVIPSVAIHPATLVSHVGRARADAGVAAKTAGSSLRTGKLPGRDAMTRRHRAADRVVLHELSMPAHNARSLNRLTASERS